MILHPNRRRCCLGFFLETGLCENNHAHWLSTFDVYERNSTIITFGMLCDWSSLPVYSTIQSKASVFFMKRWQSTPSSRGLDEHNGRSIKPYALNSQRPWGAYYKSVISLQHCAKAQDVHGPKHHYKPYILDMVMPDPASNNTAWCNICWNRW